ncbi:MAG: ABC transporter permease [Lachnospiraceae bacterium]|nr:ABC transporter permease [Lachnospiraceae bacterium]
MKRKRLWILLLSCIVCVLLALGLHGFSSILKNQLQHEQVAVNWDAEGNTAQISVFFSESEKYFLRESLEQTEFQLKNWYYQILNELETASITAQTANPTARLLLYGYSAAGEISMQSEHNDVRVKAYGVGGDFFQFHPLKLVSGGYFSESDLMQDRVILDTDTAWQLFGSNDVVGMFVLIEKIPHMVVGVYERESGYFNDAAGNDKSCVFVSHETLYNHGQYHGLESVEYLIPNPVTGFGAGIVEKQTNGMDVAIVEHQKRFEFTSLIGILKQFGTRSMGLSGITFPYWENMARGYEDILAGILLTELVLFTYAAIVFIGLIWYLWIHRKWRARGIYEKFKDICYAMRVKRHARKVKAKGGDA